MWLGIILRKGDHDTPRDPVSAFKWLKVAADLGFGRAMYELGQMYEVGSGVRADAGQARRLYGMANRNGCPVTNGRIDKIDPHAILEKDFDEVESEYLQVLIPAEHSSGNRDIDSPEESGSDKDEESDSEASPISKFSSEPTETPVELLKRLSDAVNMGGPDAKDAQREALYLFESCFGLDSDLDAMWRHYVVALSNIPLSELKFRIAQMMADRESPIYNIERAFEWFEDAYRLGYRIAAICMGDYYLEGLRPFSKNLVRASRLYIDAIRNRTEFRKVESRFDLIRKSIRDSGTADECVIIAHMLDKSNVAGHNTVMGFYTISLEKGRSDVSKDLYLYCKRNGMRYDRSKLLRDSFLSLKQNGDNDPLLMEGLRDYPEPKISANEKVVRPYINNRIKTSSQPSDARCKIIRKETSDRRSHGISDSSPVKSSRLKIDHSRSDSKTNLISVGANKNNSAYSESKEESNTNYRESKSDMSVNFKDRNDIRNSISEVLISALSGVEIARLFPQASIRVKKSVISSIENSIKMFACNPDTGIQGIASLTSNPLKAIGIYQSIPESSLSDLIYTLGLKLCSDNEFVGYYLICTAALSDHKAALEFCTDKIDIYATQNMNLAVEILRRSVFAHYPKSMFKLALLYGRYPAYGSNKEASGLLLKAVELGDSDAIALVATKMRNKECTPEESINAENSIRKAANAGYVPAMFNRGEQCWDTDPKEAIYWFTKAADKGNVEAMCRLGIIFKDNRIFRNVEKAILYLTKAGDLKNCEAFFHLGELFEFKDTRKSQSYYRKSSDLGCSKASQKLFKKDTENYKLPYRRVIKPVGIPNIIGDDSGRYLDESFIG